MKTIWAHCLVKNEERYVWYAIRSVIEYVDKIMVWDTGSTDKTVEIVKTIKSDFGKKIDLKLFGEVTPEGYTKLRQKMLEETRSDWFMILDGDEVWWSDSIKKSVDFIHNHGDSYESVVNPYINLVGDIYHFVPKEKGKYNIDGKRGHLSIRFMNKNIPGLYTSKPHGQHGYFDADNNLIQDRDKNKRYFLDAHYLHFTHLQRSSERVLDKKVPKRAQKLKYEIGNNFTFDFYYPEVFFIKRPDVVPSPWKKTNHNYVLKSNLIKPIKILKNYFYDGKSGY